MFPPRGLFEQLVFQNWGGYAPVLLSLVCESLPFRFSLCASPWFGFSSFFSSLLPLCFSLTLTKRTLLGAETPAQTKGWGWCYTISLSAALPLIRGWRLSHFLWSTDTTRRKHFDIFPAILVCCSTPVTGAAPHPPVPACPLRPPGLWSTVPGESSLALGEWPQGFRASLP